MSEPIVFRHDDTERLTDLLSSADKRTQCMGRAFASGIGPALQDWLNAELARGTDRVVLLDVVADLGIQHVACVAAASLDTGGDTHVKELLAAIIEQKFSIYTAAIRSFGRGDAA